MRVWPQCFHEGWRASPHVLPTKQEPELRLRTWHRRFEVFGEKFGGEFGHFRVREPAVAGAFYRVEEDRHTSFLESGIEQLTLMMWHKRVGIPVANQKRWRTAGDVSDGIGASGFIFVLLDGTTDQVRFGRVSGIVLHSTRKAVRVHLEEIGGAVIVHDGLDTAGDGEIIADFEFGYSTRGAQHGGQVAACGVTPGGKVGWVQAVSGSVRPEPADGSFAVLNLGGKNRVLAQAVADGSQGVAFRQVLERDGHLLVAHPEGATMDVNNQRQVCGVWGQVKIQALARMALLHVRQVAMNDGPFRWLGPAGTGLRTADPWKCQEQADGQCSAPHTNCERNCLRMSVNRRLKLCG